MTVSETSAAAVKETNSATPANTSRSYVAASGWYRSVILLVLALALATVGVALAARPETGPIALVALGILSAIGLAALFAIASGVLGLARDPAEEARLFVSDTLDVGLAMTDAKGRVVYSNGAYAECLGGKTKTPDRALAREADAAEALYRLGVAARDGASDTEDIRLSGRDTSRARWLRVSTAPVTSRRGKYALWKVADISGEASRQEDTFHELQQIINYLDHAPAGFFSLGSEGRIAYVNATLAGWLGLTLDRTTGGALGLDDIMSPEAAAALNQIKPVKSGSRVERVDLDLRKVDGTRLPVRVIHRTTFDDRSRLLYSRSLVLERAAVPTDAEGMRAMETRFLGFFGAAPIGIAMIDAGGTVDRCNSAFTRLFAVGNLKGKALVDLVNDESRPSLVTALQQGRLGKAIAAPVDVAFSGDRVGQIYFSILDDAPGRVGGLLVYAIDRTEQRVLETQISQGQKMQAVGQLAGGVAHDFNNVLTAIIGFSDLLLANHRPTDPSFQDIMNIRQNANRAAALVRQLLAFSRQQTMRPEVVQLSDTISEVSSLLNRLLGEKTELQVSHGRDLWPVKTDANQFEQVIVNLVVNARDAMPNGGAVKIMTANVPVDALPEKNKAALPDADYVEIAVSDTGSGIPKENLEKIFDPFFSTKDVGKGTGLGLSTVYGIVKQTGGHIFVDSEIDEGTTFRIYLPRHLKPADAESETGAAAEATGALPTPKVEGGATEAASATSKLAPGPESPAVGKPASLPPAGNDDLPSAETAQGQPASISPKKQKKVPPSDLTGQGTILRVEDEDAVRAFASRALESKGYKVLSAPSGEEALEIVEENEGTIDLVVSDVIMPEMDGPTLVKELQKRHPDLKIVFISGYAEAEFRKSLEDSEEFSFLPKPFSLKQLAEVVKMKIEG